jgi:hypothetical protein
MIYFGIELFESPIDLTAFGAAIILINEINFLNKLMIYCSDTFIFVWLLWLWLSLQVTALRVQLLFVMHQHCSQVPKVDG